MFNVMFKGGYMSLAKSYRIDEEIAATVKKLWRQGLELDEDLRESEIVNYVLKKNLETTDIKEIVEGRKKRWYRT